MIRLDWLIGVPLCALAFVLRLPFRAWAGARRPGPPRSILVIKFLGMGSVLLSTPVLQRLRETCPDAKVTFLTLDPNAELVRRLSCVDEVLSVPKTSLPRLLFAVPRLLLELRRRRFDVALDLEFYSRLSALIAWGSGARQRIGFFVRGRWRGSVLTDTVYFNPTLPFGEAVVALLRPLGLEDGVAADLIAPTVPSDEAEASWARLQTLGVPADGAVVVVNVNASDLCDERRWPEDRFAELVTRFEEEIASVGRLVFIGGPGETGPVRRVLEQVGEDARPLCLDLAGRTTLAELTVLLGRASLLITNDSGPLHLAASLGTPTISLFGPETPALYGPVGDNHLVFYAGHWCSPCLTVYNAKIAWCDGDNVCMRRISVDAVVAQAAVFCRERVGLVPPHAVVRPRPGAVTGKRVPPRRPRSGPGDRREARS